MGSSLFPDYTMEKNPYMKLKFWQVFSATKKTSGEKVSIFIFEKKLIDKKNEKEKNIILTLLKKEPEILHKIKKHKNILKIIEPLAEDSYNIGFITEYVNYNLKDWIKNYKPSKFEIKYIIYQLLTIIFSLHNDYQLSHNNLNTENIFIDENNFIKISNLALSTSLINNNNSNNNITQINLENFCDLNFCAPELILNNDINNNSDNYSLGLIFYFLIKNCDENFLYLMDNTFDAYKNSYENLNIEKKIKKFKDNVFEEFLFNLINIKPEKRKNLNLLQNSKFFIESEENINNKLISLCLLSKMDLLDLSKNYELLKQLPNIINLYTTKEKEYLILPNLLFFIKQENLINPIIPSIFILCEQEKQKIIFSEKIWPNFKFLFNMKKLPGTALYLILKKISFFIQNLGKDEFNKHCIPLICKALDCGVQKIQETILEELPKILNDLDKNELKNNIYNKLINILLQTKNIKLKTNIMNCLQNLCDYFDSYFINNKFLDDIEKIIKAETTLSTCKNALILYEKIEPKVNDKSVRSKIIPSLLLMMCNGEISESLFNKGEKIIQEYIKKIKEKRKEQFIKEININLNFAEEIKENVVNNIYSIKNNSNNNKDNLVLPINNNDIGMNSPLSMSKTKSTLSGNISLIEYNSSEDSNLDIIDKNSKNNNNSSKNNNILKKNKNKTTEKKIETEVKDIYKNNQNDNLFANLLGEDKNEESISNDSNNIGKTQSKNILKFVDKKEFLSSLELKQVEAKKNSEENNIISDIINNKEKEEKIVNIKSNNLWEEIEGDDENNDNLNKFIKKKKKSGSIKDKEKNKVEKNDKIKSNKKWDEDEDDDNNDIIKEIQEKNIEQKNDIVNTENKDTTDNKNNTGHKKIKKKKKKKKEKDKEKVEDSNINTIKSNKEKRASNINFESLLDD